MDDQLIRGTAMNGHVRILAVQMKSIVEQLRQRHDTWPVATAALGRTLAVGAMMGAMMKGEEKLILQIKGDGPIGQIVVDANAEGVVRGYVDNPHVDLPSNEKGKLDVAGAVGREGAIYVTKDLGMKEPYRGSIPIISGEIAEDFTYYFAKSEQTPSAVALGVLVDTDHSVRAAGGFIIQILPGASDQEIEDIEKALAQQKPLTKMLDQGITMNQIITSLLPSFVISSSMNVQFRCKCSEERVRQTLISLGKEEIKQMIEEDGQAEVICHFCNEKYQYDESQLYELLSNN